MAGLADRQNALHKVFYDGYTLTQYVKNSSDRQGIFPVRKEEHEKIVRRDHRSYKLEIHGYQA